MLDMLFIHILFASLEESVVRVVQGHPNNTFQPVMPLSSRLRFCRFE